MSLPGYDDLEEQEERMLNFRPSAASEAKPLVGLFSESGCGKTKSALLLARGFAGDMSRVGMIETESGRGEAYANERDVGGYQVLPLREDFSPKRYGEAISAAEKAGLQVLIIDSASHEWEGIGGVLDQAASNQAAGKKGVLVWQQPKILHAREFMSRLLQTPIPLVIVCMRAKYPMVETVKDGRKEWVRSTELEPKQSEDILYEMFIHGWIDKQHRFHGTKYTVDALREVFQDGQPIDLGTGRRLAEWTKSGARKPPHDPTAITFVGPKPLSDECVTPAQIATLEIMCVDGGIAIAAFKKAAKVEAMEQIAASRFESCKKWIAEHRAA